MPDTDPRPADAEVLLTAAEVAALFRVSGKTVDRWEQAGKIRRIRGLGKHRRFPAEQFAEYLEVQTAPAADRKAS